MKKFYSPSLQFLIIVFLLTASVPEYASGSELLEALDIKSSTEPLSKELRTVQSFQGDTIHLDHNSKYTLLNFWSTWCVPCRDELKHLNKLHSKFSGRGFRVVAVNVGETETKVTPYANELNLKVPIVLDPDRKIHKKFDDSRFFQLPRSLFIRPGGIIEANFPGALNFDKSAVRSAIKNMVGKQPSKQ